MTPNQYTKAIAERGHVKATEEAVRENMARLEAIEKALSVVPDIKPPKVK